MSDAIDVHCHVVPEKFPAYADLVFMPGERSQYSNVGYMVLGAVIEAVSGQSYEEYALRNILQPLKMDRTHFVVTQEMAEQEAAGSQHLINLFTPDPDRLWSAVLRRQGGTLAMLATFPADPSMN